MQTQPSPTRQEPGSNAVQYRPEQIAYVHYVPQPGDYCTLSPHQPLVLFDLFNELMM